MDFIIVDGDCQSLWNVPELERRLGAEQDHIWFLSDSALRENEYNAHAAAGIPPETPAEKGILITRLQSGVMKYHRELLRSTSGCKRWIIAVLGAESPVYRKQYGDALNSALTGTNIRCEVLFEDSEDLLLTAQAKREIVDGRPYCIIATRSNDQLAGQVRDILAARHEDWRFECHTGYQEDPYKYADIVLVVGREAEDCQVPAVRINTGRVRIWLDTLRGQRAPEETVIAGMNASGWDLGSRRVFSSCLDHETLLSELDKGEISAEALLSDERFIMWDSYGLPLPDKAYRESARAEAFLRKHCCFAEIF